MLKSLRGMNDLLGSDIYIWNFIEFQVNQSFLKLGYKEIKTPIVESLNTFIKTVGKHTDIIAREMYFIKDINRKLVLRPEGTSGVARALIQSNKIFNNIC